MNNNNAKTLQSISCTHPPVPLLLQAKEGGEIHFAHFCEAERVPIAIGRGEFMILYN
jgi:hypothetical protein